MHTYTLTFSGTMYHTANSADEAHQIMMDSLSEIASDYQVEVSE